MPAYLDGEGGIGLVLIHASYDNSAADSKPYIDHYYILKSVADTTRQLILS